MIRQLKHIVWLLLVIGCANVDLLEEIDPTVLSRQVGPEGGIVTFYSGSIPQDIPAAARVLVQLDIPPGALAEEVVFEIENVGGFQEQVWQIQPALDFNVPVELSYRVNSPDTSQTDAFCYYKPMKITSSGDTTLIDDFELNEQTSMMTISVNSLDGSTYQLSVDYPYLTEYRTQNFVYCSTTNPDFLGINLSLAGNDGYASNNMLYVAKESVIPPGYVSVTPLESYPRNEVDDFDFGYNNYYDEIYFDDFVAIPFTDQGKYYRIDLEGIDPTKPVALYFQSEYEYPYNYEENLDKLRMFRVDAETLELQESIPVEMEKEFGGAYIFKSEITTSGVYFFGTETEDFNKWVGGTLTMTATSDVDSFNKTYSSDDQFGAYLFCSGGECLIESRINAKNGEVLDGDEFAEMFFYYVPGSEYLEVYGFEVSEFRFDDNGTFRSIHLVFAEVQSFNFTAFENKIGGKLTGTITAKGRDLSNSRDYTVNLDFDIKVYKSYEN